MCVVHRSLAVLPRCLLSCVRIRTRVGEKLSEIAPYQVEVEQHMNQLSTQLLGVVSGEARGRGWGGRVQARQGLCRGEGGQATS